MAQPLASTSIEALIEGGVSGQVAVGNKNVQIHADHGAVVFFTAPRGQPAIRPRPLPVLLRPRAVRGLLDRRMETAAASAAIATALPVGIHGRPGSGKSTLLRHLAYAVEGAPADGVIHLSARQQPAEDLVQCLFEAFYECDAPFKPTPVQARRYLEGRKALVLLDDAELERDDAGELLDAAPHCAFVLVSQERCLWGECQAIGIGGLPADDARALFERELGRPLAAAESGAFASLLARLEGHPLRLLQAAAQVREGVAIAAAAPADEGDRRSLDGLSDDEKRALSVLAAVGGGPLGAAHLAALVGLADPAPAVDALLGRRLIQAHSPRYSLAGDLPALLPRTLDLSAWRRRALDYFVAWAEACRNEPSSLLQEAGPLRHLLDRAVESGRHAEAQRLGRALDTALTVSGRWGAWKLALERVHAAARAVGDRGTEGWALHQLGTRLLCLDDKAAAQGLLTQALAIRESLGDRGGAAVTRHNLGLLVPVPPHEPSPDVPTRSTLLRLLPWLGLALVLLTGIVVGVNRLSDGSGDDPHDLPPTPAASPWAEIVQPTPQSDAQTPEATPEPVVEATPEPTATPTAEPTPSPETSATAQPPAPVQGWCCADGKLAKATDVDCRERQGVFSKGHFGASFACALSSTGCCVAGEFKAGTTQDECGVLEGAFMSLAEVPFKCRKPRQGWCCDGGNVSQESRETCESDHGSYFESQAEAERSCSVQ